MTTEIGLRWAGVPVVDAHTHAFSPDRIREREKLVSRDRWFRELYSNPNARLVDADQLNQASEGAGIAHTVACGFPWSDQGVCHEENRYLAEIAKKSGGSVSWLGMVVPGHPLASAEAEWCFANGAVGLGEFNSDGQAAPLESRSHWEEIVEVARLHDRPLLLHTSEAVGHHYPGKGTATPVRLLAWLGMFPAINVVFAHWGGGLPFFELMPEVRNLTRRVTYDCAASTYLYHIDVFPRVIDLIGAERVLWGSDYPVLGQARFLGKSQQMLRDQREASLVLAQNAERVYRMSESKIL